MSERDDELVELYRRLPRPEPSAALDAAVLGNARAALRAHRPAWLGPVAAAAALVLAAGVGWQLRHEPLRDVAPQAPAAAPAAAADAPVATMPDEAAELDVASAGTAASAVDAAPAPQAAAAQAAPAQAAPAQAAPAQAARDAGLSRRQAEPREASREAEAKQALPGATPAREEAPRQRAVATPPTAVAEAEALAAPEPPRAAAPPPPPAPPAPAVPPVPAAPATADAAKRVETPVRGNVVGGAAFGSAPDLAARLDAIRALRDAGRRAEAADALARLREAEPGLEIPEDLRDLLR